VVSAQKMTVAASTEDDGIHWSETKTSYGGGGG
jgi:hypothetical protein